MTSEHHRTVRVSGSKLFSLWSPRLILSKYALHNSLCLSCSVGMFNICIISSYVNRGNIIFRHRLLISMLSDKYLGKFVCHIGHEYSIPSLITYT